MPLANFCGMKQLNLPLILLAAVTALVSSTAAFAGEAHFVLNGRSHHVDSSYDWNDNNTGIGFEYQFEQKSAWRKIAMANGFRDSNDGMSYMAGAGLHRRLFETESLAGFYVYAGLNVFVMEMIERTGNHAPPAFLC